MTTPSQITDLVKSVSIDNLLAQRAAYVERLSEAHRLLAEAADIASAAFGEENHYRALHLVCTYDRCRQFTNKGDLGYFVKQHDAALWSMLLDKSGLRTFMDAEARRSWDEMIDKGDVPELTRENIRATFEGMHQARGDMFERGVVAVFRHLSWDYKTNNPVKFGKRIITRGLTWVMNGEVCGVDSTGADRFDDMLRVLLVLDGKQEPDHRQGTFRLLNDAGWPKNVRDAELHGVLSVRGFKNGNAHVTFLRPDLVDEMNRIIAKHHPNALPPAKE